MASAAAVAADQARSPIENDIGGDSGGAGEVTSGVYARDDEQAGINGNAPEGGNEDEDLPSNSLRGQKRPRLARRADGEDDEEETGGDDLFGDAGDEAEDDTQPAMRQLDDEELDSGDDMERFDRVADEAEAEVEPEYIAQEKITMDVEYPRLPGPEPSDGEMYLLKMPAFMALEPHVWHHTTFQPPTNDHHNFGKPPSETFSASKTALSTLRWRHSPSNPTQLQSNARILRWSDGSLTVQLASDPSTQYEIEGKAVAPPQRNPIKPTPTSLHQGQKSGRQGMHASHEKFDQRKDGFTYLLRPYDENGTMVVTHKVTTGLSIKQLDTAEDDAVARLEASLAAATNASKIGGGDGMQLIEADKNPEQARLDALAAMRDIEKRNKKTQAAQDREAARANRALGRHGMGSSRYGGLNASMLEDEEEDGGRAKPSPHKRPKPRRRRNSEYSEDEDFGRKRFSREDEYDEEDDFLAPSDEEEVVEDDDDPDDGIVEERPSSSRKERERTPKRGRDDVDDEDADAPGEEDEDDAPQASRGQAKKRRVVDEDDDDDEE